MSIATSGPQMSRAQFFDWAEVQDERFEFDGFQPVAMTGGTVRHNMITQTLHRLLYARLKGSDCLPFGPDVGVATIHDAVRYPDALVTCSKVSDTDRLVSGVVVVFEVLSPTSGRNDRIIKLREYHAVASIRRYVILEYASIALTVLSRKDADDPWTVITLMAADILRMPEIGIEIPVASFYEDTEIAEGST